MELGEPKLAWCGNNTRPHEVHNFIGANIKDRPTSTGIQPIGRMDSRHSYGHWTAAATAR
jgi:hypothetical protein